jgi:hypothetical protein
MLLDAAEERPLMRLDRTPFLVLIALAGCSGSSSPTGTDDGGDGLPSAAAITAFTRVTKILLVPVDVAGTTGLLGVDTGDPFVLLNPTTFPGAPAVGSVATLSVESDHLTQVPVITSSDSPTSPDPSITLGGLLGCTIICKSVVSFNYRDTVFTLGSSASPSGLQADVKLPFALKGGGMEQSGGIPVTEPPSRVVVSVDIEGTMHTMIVDTGASSVTVNQALYSALTADGRVQLSGGTVDTTSGMSSASFTRAKTVSVGGADATGVVVAHDSAFDTILESASADAGETIEGSLGGTFLDNFFLTIDYPNTELHFARYSDTSFIYDPAEIVGVSLGGESPDGYIVEGVFAGSDAASKGVTPGDQVVAIDGQKVGGLTASETSVLLGGKVGSSKMIQFGTAKTLGNMTVSIQVSELLPLPM